MSFQSRSKPDVDELGQLLRHVQPSSPGLAGAARVVACHHNRCGLGTCVARTNRRTDRPRDGVWPRGLRRSRREDSWKEGSAMPLRQMGGEPTTRWLSHSDEHLDPMTKSRYHTFLASQIPDWIAPTPEDESASPKASEVAYESAVRWLQERIGNSPRHSLVFKENVSYGFRRNLYGLKSPGLAIAGVCTAANVVVLLIPGLVTVGEPITAASLSLLLCLLSLCAWIWIVREPWVKDAGDGYARALLATCDQGLVDDGG